ncbi:MAG: HAMP domain-containing sensor histidine kinase [Pseudomonadota bacterium]
MGLIALQLAAAITIATQAGTQQNLPWVAAALAIAALIGLVFALGNGGAASRTARRPADEQPTTNAASVADTEWSSTKTAVHPTTNFGPASVSHLTPNLTHDALTELLQQVHHELRTPLNAVLGFTDLMQQETFGPLGSPRYAEYLSHIRESGELLLKSTEETLAMTTALTAAKDAQASEASQTSHSSTCLHDLAKQAWSRLPVETTHLGFELSISGRSADIAGDPLTIRQAMTNLFAEAIAQSQASGRIEVNLESVNSHVRVEVSGADPLPENAVSTTSLDLCLARTLLQQYGGGLLTTTTPGDRWRSVTVFERATQHDLFKEQGVSSSPVTTQQRFAA